MRGYEVRILKDDLSTKTILEQQYFDDHAAIRSAKQFASGHPFEVWRGLSCIYGAYVESPSRSPRSAA